MWSLSAAVSKMDVQLHMVVRGERKHVLTPTLQDAQKNGARLHFVPRAYYDMFAYSMADSAERIAYDDTNAEGEVFDLSSLAGSQHRRIVPSGGSNALGIIGAARLGAHLAKVYPNTDIYCAAGTGGFALGLALGICLKSQGRAGGKAKMPSAVMSDIEMPRIVGLCVADSETNVMAKNQSLLTGCLEHLQNNALLLESFGLNQTQLSRLHADIASLPLQFIPSLSSFRSQSKSLLEFRVALESKNQEAVDSIYMLPLLHHLSVSQNIPQTGRSSNRRALVIHTGGQQGIRSHN